MIRKGPKSMTVQQHSDTRLLLGAKLSHLEKGELLAAVAYAIDRDQKLIVLSGNVYAYNLAYQHAWFRHFFNRADIIRLDGVGVRLGATILGYDTPHRMTWADFGWDLAEFAADNEYTLYFLGARPGIAQRTAECFRARFPRLRIVGTHHGYFDKTSDSVENNAVIQEICELNPNILILGFGMPLQERWLMENWDHIDVNVAFTGGAVFDYISGELHRAPRWMTKHGLEWLGRLLVEPRRLWRRYLIGNPLFIWRVVRQRLGWSRFGDREPLT